MTDTYPSLTLRTRTEGIALRPFSGLDELQSKFNELTFIVNNLLQETAFAMNSSVEVPSRQVNRIGLRIDSDDVIREIQQSLVVLGYPLQEVSFVVVARDSGRSPLRETVVVKSVPMNEMHDYCQIVAVGDERPRPMRNRFDGFDLEFDLILNRDRPKVPLKASIQGSILASGHLRITTQDLGSSLQPRELTPEIRQAKNLPPSAWFHVEIGDDLIESVSLADVVTIWVDSKYLRDTHLLRTHDRALAEHVFTVAALADLVMEGSKELEQKPTFEFDGNNSALLALLFRRVRGTLRTLSYIDLQNKLKRSPQEILSHALSGSMQNTLRNAVANLIGAGDEA